MLSVQKITSLQMKRSVSEMTKDDTLNTNGNGPLPIYDVTSLQNPEFEQSPLQRTTNVSIFKNKKE